MNVRDFLLAHRDQLKFYMNLHSYGEMVLLPWAYTEEKPDNIDQLTEVIFQRFKGLQKVAEIATSFLQVATLGADAMKAGYQVQSLADYDFIT